MRHLTDDLTVLDLPRPDQSQADYKRALSCFATGVTVVTTRWEGADWGMTCNSFASVSLEPRLVLWSIRRAASSLDAFTRSGRFSVSVLSTNQQGLARQFATGDMASRFIGVEVNRQKNQCLRLSDAVAFFDCELHELVPAGDHLILIGHVSDFGWQDKSVLGFCQSAFGQFMPLPA